VVRINRELTQFLRVSTVFPYCSPPLLVNFLQHPSPPRAGEGKEEDKILFAKLEAIDKDKKGRESLLCIKLRRVKNFLTFDATPSLSLRGGIGFRGNAAPATCLEESLEFKTIVVNLRDPKIIHKGNKGKEAVMFNGVIRLIDRVRGQRSEPCTKVLERRGYDDSGMPIPRCKAEELQMRYHLSPRLHHDLPAGLHNN